ncbi:Uncharacterised protein [Mycobacteroides abscessus subsp. abscessus]|nr:Uncharacterised protein [Mycobacteroides abscessus subsp. abscessus]
MYTPQFSAMRSEAPVSSPQLRSPMATRSRRRRETATTTAISSSVQSMRCARISSAPAGSSSGKNAGNNPHIRYAAAPNRYPDFRLRFCSGVAGSPLIAGRRGRGPSPRGTRW